MLDVLIAGASRGIGLGLVRAWLHGGARVFAVARDPAASAGLGELAGQFGERLQTIACDLNDPQAGSLILAALGDARLDRVLVANALGSGVLESPGLPGFLPAISEHLLGEELLLPSIASWWCGEPPVLDEALEKLDQLLVRPALEHITLAWGRDFSDVSPLRGVIP